MSGRVDFYCAGFCRVVLACVGLRWIRWVGLCWVVISGNVVLLSEIYSVVWCRVVSCGVVLCWTVLDWVVLGGLDWIVLGCYVW